MARSLIVVPDDGTIKKNIGSGMGHADGKTQNGRAYNPNERNNRTPARVRGSPLPETENKKRPHHDPQDKNINRHPIDLSPMHFRRLSGVDGFHTRPCATHPHGKH
jgi:hypothetical protein